MLLTLAVILPFTLSSATHEAKLMGNVTSPYLQATLFKVGDAPEGKFYGIENACGPAEDGSACESLVRKTLEKMVCKLADDIPHCMQLVFDNNQNLGVACCDPGTEYDRFLLQNVDFILDPFLHIDDETAVVVMDMQQDRTTGSFPQPCWTGGGTNYVDEVNKFVTMAAEKKALIIAVKDLHPSDHCSFAGQPACLNIKDYTDDVLSMDKRYVNEFPSHCVFNATLFEGDNYAAPLAAPNTPYCQQLKAGPYKDIDFPDGHFCTNENFFGAALEPSFATTLGRLRQLNVEVVFKGFNKQYESLSAITHLKSSGTIDVSDMEKLFTGSYALPTSRAINCHNNWDLAECYPTIQELSNPDKLLRSTLEKVISYRHYKRLIVIGLSYDLAVTDTAIFALEAAEENIAGRPGWLVVEPDVKVLGDLSRPEFDGKPGAPYNSAGCEGLHDGSFCTNGGGTMPQYKRAKVAIEGIGAEVVRRSPSPPCPAPPPEPEDSGSLWMIILVVFLLLAVAAWAVFYYKKSTAKNDEAPQVGVELMET